MCSVAKGSSVPTSHLPSRRVILLGASNLTRAISTAVETACRLWGRPLDVMAAFGHGRSYGERRTMLGRELPGIVECGLWQALKERAPAPTAALITDIGNDLLYGEPAETILGWVEACLDHIQKSQARVVITLLPLGNLARLSRGRFLFFRSVFFPGCGLSFSQLLERAAALDQGLRDLGRKRDVVLVEHQRGWYGMDPIHIRRRHWPEAWQAILAGWSDAQPLPAPASASLRRWLYLRRLAPERRWFFGWERRRPQPTGILADGSTLAFY